MTPAAPTARCHDDDGSLPTSRSMPPRPPGSRPEPAAAAEIQREGEMAPHIGQAVGETVGGFADQEVMGREPCGGTVSPAAQQARSNSVISSVMAALCTGPGPRTRAKVNRAGRTIPGLHSAMLAASLRRATGRVLDLVLPPRCVGCGRRRRPDCRRRRAGALCAGCWSAIEFLAPPFCRRCGYPFEFELGPETLCPACQTAPPVFDRARAVFRYDAGSRSLLLSFKHGDRTDLAPPSAAGWPGRGRSSWPRRIW